MLRDQVLGPAQDHRVEPALDGLQRCGRYVDAAGWPQGCQQAVVPAPGGHVGRLLPVGGAQATPGPQRQPTPDEPQPAHGRTRPMLQRRSAGPASARSTPAHTPAHELRLRRGGGAGGYGAGMDGADYLYPLEQTGLRYTVDGRAAIQEVMALAAAL